MSVNEPGSIGIPINPDGSDFAIDLNKILTKTSKNAKVEVQVTVDKSDITKVKNTIDKGLGTVDVKVKPDVTKTDVNNIKKEISRALGTVGIKVEPTFTKTAAAEFKKELGRALSGTGGVKVELQLQRLSNAEISRVRRQIQNDIGTIRVPVAASVPGNAVKGNVVNSIVSPGAIAGTEAAAKSTRNLARDLTLVGRAATEGKSSVFSFLGSVSVGQVALTAFSTGVIQATKSFIKFGLESSKQVQSVERVFKGFVGNASVVSKLFGELQDFAAVTPFDLEGLLKSSRTLLGAGFKPTELINSLQDISGAGAQLGVTSSAIERVTIALAKIKGQGKVTQRELRTIFTAFPGFNPIKAIADNIERFGGNTGKALKAVTAGGIKADEAVTALLKGMEKFPGAANALYSQSLTLAGSQETLRDRFQQVARAASDPTLNNLASNYRKAADDFKNQSLTSGATSGITELINAGAKFVPVFGKLAVPALNAFGAALAPVVDTVAEFTADGGGEAFLTAFETGVKILPVFNVGLSTTLTILKPFLPLIELTSKAIGAIPPQLLAMAVGLKLLGSSGGLTKNLFGKAADKLDFKKPFTDINNGIEKVKSGAKTAGTSLITAFNKNGVEQFRRETEKLTGKIENLGAKGYKVYNGPGSFFNGVLPQYTRLQAETDKLTAKTDQFATTGATFGQKVKGSFAAAGEGISNAASSVKSFASSALSSVKSFGIELAIAALVGSINKCL